MSKSHFKFWPPHLSRELTLPQTSLWHNVEVSAARFPDRASLVFYEGVTTYRELKRHAEHLAGFLQQRCGVRRGDRVALFMQNCPQFVIGYYAILRADAMVVPVNCMNLTGEVSQIIEDCGAHVMIVAQDLYPRVAPLLGTALRHAIVACYSDYAGVSGANHGDAIETTPAAAARPTRHVISVPDFIAEPRAQIEAAGVTLWRDALDQSLEPASHAAGPDDLCVLPYTSGTTGKPKGCIHKHRGVMHTAMTFAQWNCVYQDACSLAVLPLFHVTGMQSSMNAQIYGGGTIVLLPRWNREVAAQLIERHRVTNLTAVPAMVVDLVSNPDVSRFDFSSLRFLGGGGAAMPEAVARKLQELCGLTYIEGYGLSETMAPTHVNPRHRPKAQCLGIPICNTDSRIIDPVTLQELPTGEVGEIVSSGPQVLEGYWNNPEESAAAFITLDGKRFLRTGDLGRVDEEGYFFFVDRLKRMINSAGFKVWPAEVESMLYAHPDIREAVVIASRDPRSGERPKALIVLKPEALGRVTPESLAQWAREKMAAYKVPREFQLVESLPKSATGKIDWRALQERENGGAA